MARRPADEDDILDFQPEVYDDPPESDDIRGSGGQAPLLLSIALGLAMIVAILVTGWYFLADSQGTPSGEGSVPVVRADPSPIKSKPADPGGMEVPNQDKLVYELGRTETPATQGERLLPGPETPQPPPILATPKPETAEPAPPAKTDTAAKPDAAAKPGAGAQPAVITAALPAETTKPEAGKVESGKVDSGKTQPKPIAKPEPKPEVKPAEVKPTEVKPEVKTAAVATPPKLGKGSWQIQVAALRDADSAVREWASLSSTHKDLLGTLTSDVVRADLGAKGIFYRLRAGPLDEVSARRLCDELTKRKIGCLVVRK